MNKRNLKEKKGKREDSKQTNEQTKQKKEERNREDELETEKMRNGNIKFLFQIFC